MVGGFGLGRRRQHGELRALLNELGAGGKLGRSADEVALRRIDALIDQYDAGNAVAPEDTTGTGRLVARAGLCLGAYQETGDVRFLNSTIALSAQAATAAVKGSRLGAESLGNLSLGLRLLVAHTPDDWVLEAAVRTGRAAIDAFPQGDQRVHATIDLSATLNQLANRSDGVAILDESISLGRQAKAALRSASPLRFIALTHLGAALQLHHRRTGNRGTLDEAVDVLREAASLAPPARDRQGAACLSSYATALLNKAQLDHDVALFEEAVTLLRQCLSSPANPEHALYLGYLGEARYNQLSLTGDTTMLDEAISATRQALRGLPETHPERFRFMGCLALSTFERFQRTGGTNVGALDEALALLDNAMRIVPGQHPERPQLLGVRGSALLRRYELTGDPQALDEAVDVLRSALAGSTANHRDRTGLLGNLINALIRRFELTEQLDTLREAISVGRQAVADTLDGQPNHYTCLSGLGRALQRWSEHENDNAALAEALDLLRRAIDTMPNTGPDRGINLANLAEALIALYERDQRPEHSLKPSNRASRRSPSSRTHTTIETSPSAR